MAIPNVTEKRAAEAQQKKQTIYQSAIDSGVSEAEAIRQAEGSGYGSVTPRLDRMAYDEEQRQERLKSEAASAPPVKKDLRVQQLIRKFKGQAPLAETPEQFAAQINTSAGYGEESAMFTPAGKARAVESGVASGLSPTQAQAQIDVATASILKDVGDRTRIVSGLGVTPTPVGGTGMVFKAETKTNPTTTVSPEATPPTKPTKPAGREPEATVPKEDIDEETALPSTASDLVRGIVGKPTQKDVAEISRPTSAVSQVAKLLKDYGILNKANVATVMKAVELPEDVTRITPIAAKLTRLTGAATKLAPALTGLSRAAKPLQVIDPLLQAARYQTDEDFRQQQIEDTLAANEKGLAYTIGRAVVKGNPLNPLANPVPVLAAMMEAPLEARNSLKAAKGDLAARELESKFAEANVEKLKEVRRSLVSDEDFQKLPLEKKKEVSMEAGKVLRGLRDKRKKR